MMVRSDQQLCSLKDNETVDHITLPPERRDKSNFLHDKLEGKIYMEKPKGYTDYLLTCKLRNPLYWLMQGPRETKVTTFILLSITRLEEGGEVHMHYTRELLHTRTITLHHYSTEM